MANETGDVRNWRDDSMHTNRLVQRNFGGRKIGATGLTMRVPIANGTLAEGLVLRVTVPDYFERISRRRSGFNHAWEEVERVLEVSNRIMALRLQELLVEALDEGRVNERRGVSTGRLEDALLSPRNVLITGRRFAVGNVSWLNRSEAKYWRQIDSGTDIHVGRVQGRGFWLDSGGRRTPNMEGVRTGKWMPTAHAKEYAFRDTAGKSVIRKMIISKPIESQDYFGRAWRAFNPRGQALDALRQAISQVLGIPMTGVRRSWNATTALL